VITWKPNRYTVKASSAIAPVVMPAITRVLTEKADPFPSDWPTKDQVNSVATVISARRTTSTIAANHDPD
jgi:hypothetical protein